MNMNMMKQLGVELALESADLLEAVPDETQEPAVPVDADFMEAHYEHLEQAEEALQDLHETIDFFANLESQINAKETPREQFDLLNNVMAEQWGQKMKEPVAPVAAEGEEPLTQEDIDNGLNASMEASIGDILSSIGSAIAKKAKALGSAFASIGKDLADMFRSDQSILKGLLEKAGGEGFKPKEGEVNFGSGAQAFEWNGQAVAPEASLKAIDGVLSADLNAKVAGALGDMFKVKASNLAELAKAYSDCNLGYLKAMGITKQASADGDSATYTSEYKIPGGFQLQARTNKSKKGFVQILGYSSTKDPSSVVSKAPAVKLLAAPALKTYIGDIEKVYEKCVAMGQQEQFKQFGNLESQGQEWAKSLADKVVGMSNGDIKSTVSLAAATGIDASMQVLRMYTMLRGLLKKHIAFAKKHF